MDWKYWVVVAVLAAAFTASIQQAASDSRGQTIFGSPQVIDGDTIEIDPAAGVKGTSTLFMTRMVIQLWGIYAPKLGQTCGPNFGGRTAKHWLEGLVGRGHVVCDIKDWDNSTRAVAVCLTPDNIDLGQRMVRDGMAFAST